MKQLPPFPPADYPPPPAGYPVGEARRRWRQDDRVISYTPWIRRVGALLVDRLLFLLVLLLYVAPAAAVSIDKNAREKSCTVDANGATSCSAPGMGLIGFVVAAILCLIALAYWIWNWGYRQGTTGSSIGKSALKFKVISERTGQPIGFWRSLVREVAHLADDVFCIGYLLPLLTTKRQTIADMIMGTVCVPIDPIQPPAAHRGRTG